MAEMGVSPHIFLRMGVISLYKPVAMLPDSQIRGRKEDEEQDVWLLIPTLM